MDVIIYVQKTTCITNCTYSLEVKVIIQKTITNCTYSLEVKVIIEMIAWTQDDSIMALSFTYIHTFIHKTYKGGDPSGLTTTYDWFYMFSNTKLSALY